MSPLQYWDTGHNEQPKEENRDGCDEDVCAFIGCGRTGLTNFGRMMSDYEVTLINDNSQ